MGKAEDQTTHRDLVEAKHGMLGATTDWRCGTHFPKHCHLHSGVPGSGEEPSALN